MFDLSHNEDFWSEIIKARQSEAIHILRTTDRRQTFERGYQQNPLDGGPEFCALAVLGENAGIDPRFLPWNGMTNHYVKIADHYGLFGYASVIVEMNDRLMTFREIADEVESRIASTDPAIFIHYLETNQWVKPWLLEEVA